MGFHCVSVDYYPDLLNYLPLTNYRQHQRGRDVGVVVRPKVGKESSTSFGFPYYCCLSPAKVASSSWTSCADGIRNTNNYKSGSISTVFFTATNLLLARNYPLVIGLIVLLLFGLAQPFAEAKSNCEVKHAIQNRTGNISSAKYSTFYPKKFCKEIWSIRAPQNGTVTISLLYLNTSSSKNGLCEDSYLELDPLPHKRFCGNEDKTYISQRDHVIVQYVTNGTQHPGHGFMLEYITGHVPSASLCRKNEFRCKNGKCILGSWRCNNRSECADNSDEQDCSNLTPTQPWVAKCGPELRCTSRETFKLICLHRSQICNGVRDCVDMMDEKDCGCYSGQFPCGFGEDDCYSSHQHCDGIWHCKKHGGDERGCDACSFKSFSCGTSTSVCYTEHERCDGVSRCSNAADELRCTPDKCGFNGTFLCKNSRCIYENWKCDYTDDCGDNSDEINCPSSSNRVILVAVVGSLTCALLLVIALGFTCKLNSLRHRDRHRLRLTEPGGPLTHWQSEFMRRPAPPSYCEAMITSMPFEEARRIFQERRRHSRRSSRSGRHRSSNGSSRSRNCLAESSQTTAELVEQVPAVSLTERPITEEGSEGSDVPLITDGQEEAVNSTNTDFDRQGSTVTLIMPSDSDSEQSDVENDGSRDEVRRHPDSVDGISGGGDDDTGGSNSSSGGGGEGGRDIRGGGSGGDAEQEQVQFSSEDITACWRRPSPVKICGGIPGEPLLTFTDSSSLETASATCDNDVASTTEFIDGLSGEVLLGNDDEDKDSTILSQGGNLSSDCCNSTSDNNNAIHMPSLHFRIGSCDSLNSSQSEHVLDDCVNISDSLTAI